MYCVKSSFEGKQLGEASGVFIGTKKKITIPEAVFCKEMLSVAQKRTQETELSQCQAQAWVVLSVFPAEHGNGCSFNILV